MKKILLIAGLLLILGLAFSSGETKTKAKEAPVETIVEDELQIEDWMTKPFNIKS
jgi:hypothetical protein